MLMVPRRPAVPPGPSTFHAMRGLRGDFARIPPFLLETAARYPGLSSWYLPGVRFWFADDPALIEAVLIASGNDIVKGRALRRMRRLLGLGLLTSDEPLHLRQRRLVQPAFHRDRIAGYAATMIAHATAAAGELRDGVDVAIDAVMNRLALRIAAATLFSADVDDDADTIGHAVTEAIDVFPTSVAPLGELWDHVPLHPATRRFRRARAQLDGVIYRLIAQRRDEGDRGDLLSMLLAARDEDGNPMPDELLRDEALTLLIAGHETTANALTWTWDALARNPEAEARLHAELDAVLGERDPVPDDMPRLTVTRDVLAESMRLRPPVWLLARNVRRPFALDGWELRPGDAIILSPLVTQRNPLYWKEPDAFRPERWSNGETAGLPRFAYFPFGGGNRICIGEGFAWTEGVLLLATLARRWRFRPVDPSPVPLDPLVTLRPGRPVVVRPERRAAGRFDP